MSAVFSLTLEVVQDAAHKYYMAFSFPAKLLKISGAPPNLYIIDEKQSQKVESEPIPQVMLSFLIELACTLL